MAHRLELFGGGVRTLIINDVTSLARRHSQEPTIGAWLISKPDDGHRFNFGNQISGSVDGTVWLTQEGAEVLNFASLPIELDSLDGAPVGLAGVLDVSSDPLFDGAQALEVSNVDLDQRISSVRLEAASSSQVETIAKLIPALLPEISPTALRVRYSTDVARIRASSDKSLSAGVRATTLVATGFNSLIVGVLTLGIAYGQRRDNARRRALGVQRGALVAVLVAGSSLQVLVGALVGAGLTATVLLVRHQHVDVWQALGVVVLAPIAALSGAIPAAILGTRHDPAAILRVP